MLPKIAISMVAVSSLALAQSQATAEALYQRTQYQQALRVLQSDPDIDATHWELMGKCHLMLGNYKRATELFQKAVDLQPRNSDFVLWLGRSWGRRAENGAPFTAPLSAAKARDLFEKAIELDPENRDALGDLFDYYLNAPGILGGGVDKAEAVARRVQSIDPPEGYFLFSEIAEKRRQPEAAERELRKSVELARREVGHIIALARFLARQGKLAESDAALTEAERVAPGSPRVIYAKAIIYLDTHRNIEQARSLLRTYMQSQLSPDDPPKQAAEKLLKSASGG